MVVLRWALLVGATLLVVTWVMYPLTVYLLSLLRREPEARDGSSRSVSVVLATRNDLNVVRRRVRSLWRTSHPNDRMEVVVALDANTPYEPEALQDLVGVPAQPTRVVKAMGVSGKAEALNAGCAIASGEILVFADASQRFGRQTITALASPFSLPRVGAASGALILRRRRGGVSVLDAYWFMERWLRSREARLHSPVGLTGAVCAVRSSLWEPLPPGLILDDLYTPMRLVIGGHRIAFVRGAVAYETRTPDSMHEHRRKTRTLTGVLQLCAWLPEVMSPWRNPIWPQFVLHKLARLTTPYAVALILIGAIGVGAATAPCTALAAAAALAVALLSSSQLRHVLKELTLTQLSAMRATWYGLRGKWDVW